MLAKPEYFSLPDEVCCWPGRRGGAAGQGQCGKEPSGRCCWPGRCSGAAGTGSQRKQLAGALRRDGAKRKSVRKSCRSAGDAAAASWKSLPLGERRRCGKGKVLSSIGKRLNGSNQHFTPFLFQCHRPHTAIPIIIKYKRAA